MAITISGENNNDKILASDGVIDQLSGVNLVGVLTATTFSGDFIGNLTGNVTGNINNSTLLLQTGGTERVRIDSGGRVGLGINNPGSYFSSYNRVVMGRTNDTGGMTIVSAPTSGGYIAFADGTSGNEAYRGRISYYHSADAMAFNTAATERLRITNSGQVGIGSAIPADLFDVHGNSIFGAQSTADAQVQLGRRYSGNRNAYIDLVGDDTYYDYGFRIIRKNTGANAESQISHRGTGDFSISSNEAAAIRFTTQGGERLRITSAGKVGINTDNPSQYLTVRGTILKTRTDSGLGLIYLQNDGSQNGQIVINQNGGVTRTLLHSAGDSYFNGGKLFVGTTSANQNNKIIARLSNASLQNTSSASVILAENNGDSWITIGSAANNYGGILFADSGSSDIGQIRYLHSDNRMEFIVDTNERLRIASNGNIFVNNGNASANATIILSKTDAGFAKLEFDVGTSQKAYISLDASEDLVHYGASGVNQVFYAGGGKRMTIGTSGDIAIGNHTPDGQLSIRAANASFPRLVISNTDNDENINLSTYHDSNGIYAFLGANAKLNSSGNITRDTTGHRSSGIFLDARNNGYLAFYTGEASGNPTEKLRITSSGEVGISPGSVNPSAGDLSSGDSQNTPVIHVKGNGSSATGGAYNLLARFEAGGDADGTGAMIVLNHSNDRGLAIQGGRRTGNYAHGALKMIDNVGRVSDAMLIHGGAGEGVDHINFYTGVNTTTTNRLHIDSAGRVLIGTTNTANGHISASKAAVHGHLAIFKDSEGDNAGVNSHQLKFVTQSGSIAEIMATSAGAGGPAGRGGYLSIFAKPNNSGTLKEMLRVSDSYVTILRENTSLEGGQLALARASDNTAYWMLDSYGSSSTPDFRIHAAGASPFAIKPSGQTQLTIASNGNTTTPLRITNSGTGGGTNVQMLFYNGNGSTGAGALARIVAVDEGNYDSSLQFETGLKSAHSDTTTAYMKLTHQGRLGIGQVTTSSIDAKLHVESSGTADSDGILFKSGSGSTGAKMFFATTNPDRSKYIHHSGYWMEIGVHDNEGLRVRNSSNGIIFTLSGSSGNYSFSGTNVSDRNLKENIETITVSSIDLIKQVIPRTFNWKFDDNNTPHGGFIAQEMQSLFPKLVNGREYDESKTDYAGSDTGTTGGCNPTGMGFDYNGYTAYLTKAMQELIAKVESLEAEVASLKSS